jgi:mercuric ion binding protein
VAVFVKGGKFMHKIIATFLMISCLGWAEISFAERACYEVQGMTCATCGITLRSAVRKVKGVQEVKASVEKKNAVVQFDSSQTSVNAIKKAIDDVGYTATTQECKKTEG